jgi:hypothetical protein
MNNRQEQPFSKAAEAAGSPPPPPPPADERAVIYHAGNDQGLLNFCIGLARAIKQTQGDIYNSCGHCVIPVRSSKIGGVEVERLCLKELSAHGLRSEVQKYFPVYRHTAGGKVSKALLTEDARTVLAARAFLDELPLIRGICDLGLPGTIKDGELIPLSEGYNPEAGILVRSNGFSFEYDWPLEKALRYYRRIYSEFCFRGDDKRRSLAVAIAMNLTLFGFYLLDPDALRPAFLANANREGAGKTLLVKIALITRYGNALLSAMPATEEQRQKQIFSAARCRDGAVAWDNVRGDIKCASLEQALTSVHLNDRLLHTHTTQNVRHELTFLLTTNGAAITGDLRRRSLSIELHLPNLKAEDRKIIHWLDDSRLVGQRKELCAAAWALLRNWAEKGCPAPGKIIPGFEKWSLVFGGAVEAAGYACPCLAQHSKSRGVAIDLKLLAIEKLVKTIGAGEKLGKVLLFDEVWEIARKLQAVRDALQLDSEQVTDIDGRRRLGRLLEKHDGDVIGNVYHLSRHKLKDSHAIQITKKGEDGR